jgi:hypothetical protein
MKTALMSAAPLRSSSSSNNNGATVNSAAVESAVDAYASRVLATMSPPEAFIDTSLGPYVTSLLRCAEIHDKEEVTRLSEFDSLLELLEDQCSMKTEVATNALKTIADAVCTGFVPHDACHSPLQNNSPMGLYSGAGLDSFQTLKASLPEAQTPSNGSNFGQGMIDPYTPTGVGGPSPLKPDNLIPVDLLGVLDDPSPHFSRRGQPAIIYEQSPERPQVSSDEEAFPPLGSSKSAPSKKSGRGKMASKAHSNKELAASLFRPARPRQNSIENEESALTSQVPATDRAKASSNKYFQQQWDSSVEILLSMNQDLSEEAAAEAGLMANTDFNIAQYIVDAAMSAAPVCRHMLHDGCYRSDCQFSHDVEGHTCLFWLRGRCGKGTGCKFLHGYNQKLLDGIQMDSAAPAASRTSRPVPIASSSNGSGYPNPYSSFRPSSAPSSNGFGGSSLPSRGFEAYENSRLGSSWQSPSLAESLISNSYSSTSDSRSATSSSFANIASRGHDKAKFASPQAAAEGKDGSPSSGLPAATVRIPQDLWNPHENRDARVFHIPDPMDRYQKVAATVKRRDVVDLHFQSTKTFSIVLSSVLPGKLSELGEVWIVTGTGHHVGLKTHQKGGGALERAVVAFLSEEGYNFAMGRDRNGVGGAILVKR